MNSHLLAIAVGPVQEFIAAARRTRDLWLGSRLLSEVSRSIAEAVMEHGQLIFPASIDAPNVANVILAKLGEASDPKAAAADAKSSAQQRWREVYADPALAEYRGVIREEFWNDQVDDIIEFYAAWTPLSQDYQGSRRQVMRLLAGRKNCRDFVAAKGRGGVPKSSLDGQRESVLTDPAVEPWPKRLRERLRVREGEQLDVIGLVKRVAEGNVPFPSVSRVAADPWLRGRGDRLGQLCDVCREINSQDNSAVIRPIRDPLFPFDGAVVFRNRHHDLVDEVGLEPGDLQPVVDALTQLGKDPNPYLAVIIADGDKMGETLSRLTNADQHREFSATLAKFAGQAKKIVVKHHGVLVYAGGDDVFAFAPVDQCLDCARELHDHFGELLAPGSANAPTAITLSVGIAIGHCLENLEDLREYGRAAEKDAKHPDRDGLAIHLYKRGGSPVKTRAKWSDGESAEGWANAPDARISKLADLLVERRLPNRLAADAHAMAIVYGKWPTQSADKREQVKAAIEKDLLRVVAAKQPQREVDLRQQIDPVLGRISNAESLRTFAKELLIARQIATARRQAAGQETGELE